MSAASQWESQLRQLLLRLPSLSEAERERAAALVQRIKWTKENEALRFFVPHGGQLEFIREIEREGAFIVISGAGNGWGKSEIIAAIFAAIMWPMLAPPAMANLGKDWKHPKRARIYSMPAELDEIGSLQTAIKRLFPVGRYTAHKGRYNYPSVFVTDTGWVLDLFSYERDASEAAGPNIGLQAWNEPPPEALAKESIARSRAGGIILGGFTSLLENIWVVDGLLSKHDGKDIRVRYGSSCENCRQHGVNGNLDHVQIERILAQYDPDEREARFTGKPLSLSGSIFKTFSREVHVKDYPLPSAETHKFYQVVDPAIGKPLAVIYAWADATGRVHIFDEHPADIDFEGAKDFGWGVKDYAKAFKALEDGTLAGRELDRILDRHFGNQRRTIGGPTLKQEFAAEGITFRDSYQMEEEVETGILKVKDYLRYDKSKPLDNLNFPRLTVAPKCLNTIKALERWGRDPKTYKPREEYKDFADVVRYLVMDEPKWEAPRDWGNRHIARYGVGNG